MMGKVIKSYSERKVIRTSNVLQTMELPYYDDNSSLMKTTITGISFGWLGKMGSTDEIIESAGDVIVHDPSRGEWGINNFIAVSSIFAGFLMPDTIRCYAPQNDVYSGMNDLMTNVLGYITLSSIVNIEVQLIIGYDRVKMTEAEAIAFYHPAG